MRTREGLYIPQLHHGRNKLLHEDFGLGSQNRDERRSPRVRIQQLISGQQSHSMLKVGEVDGVEFLGSGGIKVHKFGCPSALPLENGPPASTVASLAAAVRMSAQETVRGHCFSSSALMSSITSNPLSNLVPENYDSTGDGDSADEQALPPPAPAALLGREVGIPN
ncbi:hypothetical protein RJ641_017700 [Dillenia turbinata]|uniref:Uncharacterized protein n=1 Tax=Dillenia turbinata TaxID=194707 RepID=A0AAN8YVS6_9MAGN